MHDFKSLGDDLYRDIEVYHTSVKNFLHYDCNVYARLEDAKPCLMTGSKNMLCIVMESKTLSAHNKISLINPINNLAKSIHAYNRAMSSLRASPEGIELRILFRYAFAPSAILPKDKIAVRITLSSEIKRDIDEPVDFSIPAAKQIHRLTQKLTKIQKKSESWSYEPLRQWRIVSPPHNDTLVYAPNQKDALMMDELWHVYLLDNHKRTINPTKNFLIE